MLYIAKIGLNRRSALVNYRRGEVYLIHEEVTAGSEIKKTRPWVIISSDASNTQRRVTALPLSTRALETQNTKIRVKLNNRKSYVVLDQIKSLDLSRVIRYQGTLQPDEMDLIDQGLQDLLALNSSQANNSSSFFYQGSEALSLPELDYSQMPKGSLLSADCEKQNYGIPSMLAMPNGLLLVGKQDYDNRDFSFTVWEVKNKRCIKTLSGHEGPINNFLLLDDNRVMTCSDDNTLRVWDIMRGECLSTLSLSPQCFSFWSGQFVCGIWGIDKLPNGQIVSCGGEKGIRLWDITKKACLRKIDTHSHCRVLKVLPNGLVACGFSNGELSIYDVLKGTREKVVKNGGIEEFGFEFGILAMQVLPTGNIITTRACFLELWDLESAICLQQLIHPPIHQLGILPNGYVTGVGNDGFGVFDISQAQCIQKVETPQNSTAEIFSVLPDGHIVTGASDGIPLIWEFPEKGAAPAYSLANLAKGFCSVQ